ncbi:MAG TPA: ABC transporter substrate-binding protein [Vicinamibacteria bacterium]|nr:ABC transporter substrate-binding protein [Vicinamibacteria bacterium]
MGFRAGALLTAVLCVCGCRGESGRATKAPESLRVLLSVEPPSLDPQLHFDDVSAVVLDNIFDPLVRFGSSMRLTQGLALRWINPDDRTWRFSLDTAARFHDGSPVTAADVKFSLDRVRTLPGSEIMGFARHIVDAVVVDEHTVDVRTDTPIAILNSLAFIPIMSEKHVKAAGPAVGERPFGSGPYRFVSWERGRRIVLEASEHHKERPQVRRAEFIIAAAEDAAVLRAIEEQKPQLAALLRWSLRDELEKRRLEGLRLVSAGGLGVYYLAFNLRPELPGRHGRNPLTDPRVRKALSVAIDRDALARDGWRGGRAAHQLVVPSVFGYDPAQTGDPHDPGAAQRLLDEAGQRSLTLKLLARPDRSNSVENALIAQWSKLGVRASLDLAPFTDLQRRLASGEFEAVVQGFACTSGDASELISWALHSGGAQGDGSGNYGAFASPVVDQLASENLRVFDPRRRLEMLQQALRIVAQERPLVPLFASDDLYLISEDIRWEPAVNGLVQLRDIAFAPGAPGR